MEKQTAFMEYHETVMNRKSSRAYKEAITQKHQEAVRGIPRSLYGIQRSFHGIPRNLNGISRSLYGIPRSFIECKEALMENQGAAWNTKKHY